ncbi:hypothetical protein BD626DRAFT_575668 [Schizophyllum amplum]|uniref:Uncharacterized protein n=1 Tax=Schizophyllum amplum TaxID=97359 RepID=A0A550BVH1_9AGAR|nr:hypothetical protein BD626DRAFT_575668 [Auriculariopsis ampla]
MSAHAAHPDQTECTVSTQQDNVKWQEMCQRLERINQALVVRNNDLQEELIRMRKLYEPESDTEEESGSEGEAESEQSDDTGGRGADKEDADGSATRV